MAGSYERLELLGSGSYGKAWLVHCLKKQKRAVLKEIRLDILSEKEMSQALVEVKILARCRHVNIISYHEAFVSSGCLQIVMEYGDGGDMQKRILDQRGIHFDKEIILDWFIQICFALKYLHSENILHRDLKPQNLFLTSEGIVKVGDFGIARVLQDASDHALTAIGTPYYLSPEICQRQPYNFKSDMWSVGCVLYELCCLRVPFQAQNLPLLVLKILDGQVDPLPSHCGPILEDLVSVLLKINPSQRPSADQVLNVPALLPYVKSSYRKCIRHRDQRRRQRSVSSHLHQLVQRTPDSQGDQKPLPSHKTYNVKSPLMRHLSTATPKLKAAIKRQRAVHSADAASVVKKQRKGSPPTLDLFRQVMQKPQPCYSRHYSEFEDEINHRGDGPSSLDEDSDCSDEVDDVFDDGPPQLGNDCEKINHQSPELQTDTGDLGSPQVRTCIRKQQNIVKHPVLKIESMKPGQNVSRKGTNKIDHGGSYSGKESEHVAKDTELEDDGVQLSDVPVCDKQPVKTYRDKSRHASCGSEVGREESVINVGAVKTPSSKPPQSSCGANRPQRDERKQNIIAVSKQQNVQAPALRGHPEQRRVENSATYSVEQPGLKVYSCSCEKNGPLSSQRCVIQILYRAAALKLHEEKSAKHVLSKFLHDHLGAKLSQQLSAAVRSALETGADYSALERSIDKESKVYLPVVLQLL